MPLFRASFYLVILMLLMTAPSIGKSASTGGQMKVSAAAILELCKSSQFSGMDRSNVIRQIGPPDLSDEYLPRSEGSTVIDFYRLPDRHGEILRIDYDSGGKEANYFVEPGVLSLPKALTEPFTNTDVLASPKLDSFLACGFEKIRGMSTGEVNRKLGQPSKSWQEQSHAGGRSWHWINYSYITTKDGRQAFLIRFDDSNKLIYDYRTQAAALSMKPEIH
jgi:hypothetical protein